MRPQSELANISFLFWLVHTGASALSEAEKEEIVNKHNELRRGVNPTASNMLEMVS